MVIANFFSNRNWCKISTKSMDRQHGSATSKTSKLSRFFNKLAHPAALASHHSDHRHLLKRPSMAQMNPPMFQSDSQIRIIDQRAKLDKDKMYERWHYQQTTKRMEQEQCQQFSDHAYLLQKNEHLGAFHDNDNDPYDIIRRRPSLTTSPSFDGIPQHYPSIPSSDRNSTINANIHSDDNSISSSDNFEVEDNTDYIHGEYLSDGDDTERGMDDDDEDVDLENSHGESTSILLKQPSPPIIDVSKLSKDDNSNSSIESITIMDDKMTIKQTTPPTQPTRKIAAPSSIQQPQQHKHHVPWIVQELRRMNTISNNSYSSTKRQASSSSSSSSTTLQRNRSYVIRKGRFEISIEPSD